MRTLSPSNQINFLRGAWRAILQDQPEPFAKDLLTDFMSSAVLAGLPSLTTLEHVLQECSTREAFRESYIKSFLGLRRVWDQLTPESRHNIVRHGDACDLHKHSGLRLEMLQDEAARACRSLGLEMLQPRGLPRHN